MTHITPEDTNGTIHLNPAYNVSLPLNNSWGIEGGVLYYLGRYYEIGDVPLAFEPVPYRAVLEDSPKLRRRTAELADSGRTQNLEDELELKLLLLIEWDGDVIFGEARKSVFAEFGYNSLFGASHAENTMLYKYEKALATAWRRLEALLSVPAPA